MIAEAKWSDFGNLDAERLLLTLNQALPRWVALLLVIAIAWQIAQVIWMLIPGSDSGDQSIAPPAQISRTTTARTAVDVQTIANAHLFGEADAEPVVAVPTESHENLAETRLNLSLKGTLASDDPENAIAIIADARNEEKMYLVRDTVTQGATLHAVYADRVVLNRGGVLEELRLPKDFPQSSAPVRRNTTSVSRTATPTTTNAQSIQNVVTENASKLADVIRPTPYFVSGQMQGYRVYPGRDRKQFAALGLRPGDLIKDIDGAALTDPQQAMQVFQNLGDAEQVSVTVERNGQPEVLVLRTSQLELDQSQ